MKEQQWHGCVCKRSESHMLQKSSHGNIAAAEQRPEDAEDPVARRDGVHLFV